MQKMTLDSSHVQYFILENRYEIDPERKFISRCIDGRYEDSLNLPALAIAGADLGDLAVVAAAGNEFGFDLNFEKAAEVLTELVGGIKNFSFHTDSHADSKIAAGGCGHIKQINLNKEAYNLTQDQVKSLRKIAEDLKKKGANQPLLQGEHQEGAVFIVKGNYGILPQYDLKVDGKTLRVQAFVFHKTLVDERHRQLAKKLIEEKAVQLFNGLDDQYLYEVISEVTEDHLFETMKRLAKGLRIFEVNFESDGGFKVEEIGIVTQ